MKSEEINELAAALVAAQAEFSAVPKGSTNPFFKSKYAALPDVVLHAGPVLAKHGLAVSQFIDGEHLEGDALVTYLIHKSGQYISHVMKLHLTKDDAQGQGSATTYARRYSYMSVLGLVADDDDDGNAASRPTAKPVLRVNSSTGRPSVEKPIDDLRKQLAKKFDGNAEKISEFINGKVGRPAKTNDLSDAEIAGIMLELS